MAAKKRTSSTKKTKTKTKARPATKKGGAKSGGAKKKASAEKSVAKPVAAKPLKQSLRNLAEEAGSALAISKNNDRLDTKGAPTALPQLTDNFVRTKVLEVAGLGRATEEERATMLPIFKQAFADKWAQLVAPART